MKIITSLRIVSIYFLCLAIDFSSFSCADNIIERELYSINITARIIGTPRTPLDLLILKLNDGNTSVDTMLNVSEVDFSQGLVKIYYDPEIIIATSGEKKDSLLYLSLIHI